MMNEETDRKLVCLPKAEPIPSKFKIHQPWFRSVMVSQGFLVPLTWVRFPPGPVCIFALFLLVFFVLARCSILYIQRPLREPRNPSQLFLSVTPARVVENDSVARFFAVRTSQTPWQEISRIQVRLVSQHSNRCPPLDSEPTCEFEVVDMLVGSRRRCNEFCGIACQVLNANTVARTWFGWCPRSDASQRPVAW